MSKLIDVADKIDRVLRLVKAAKMVAAADSVPEDVGDPMVTLIDVIEDELRATRDFAFYDSQEAANV